MGIVTLTDRNDYSLPGNSLFRGSDEKAGEFVETKFGLLGELGKWGRGDGEKGKGHSALDIREQIR